MLPGLGVANLVIWLTGRGRGIEADVKQHDNEDMLQSMREDGLPDRPA